MNATYAAGLIKTYEAGGLSAFEVANGLLFTLVSEAVIDTTFFGLMQSFPKEIQKEFSDLMLELKGRNFEWCPLMIGPGPTSPDPMRYAEKLRQIDANMRQV